MSYCQGCADLLREKNAAEARAEALQRHIDQFERLTEPCAFCGDTVAACHRVVENRADSPTWHAWCYIAVLKQRADALAAELAAIRSGGQWQPIESAPKDGTLILLLGSTGARDVGQWFQAEPDRGWWTVHALKWEPRHWQSLPAPPVGSARAGEQP